MTAFRIFRTLLIAQPLLILVALGVAFLAAEVQEPEVVDDGLYWFEERFGPVISLSILLTFLAGYVVSLIGLYHYRRWGRALFLIGLLVGLAISPFMDEGDAAPIESALDSLAVMLDGAILALAFVGPVADRIAAHTPDKSPDA